MPTPNAEPDPPTNPDKQDPINKLGSGFLFLLWGLIFICLYFVSDAFMERKNNPNQRPSSFSDNGINEVQLKRNRYHHYVATGAINGQAVRFLVDTGATQVALSEKTAQQLGLAKGRPGYALTANGRTPTYATRIDRLQIGNIVLFDVAASITQGMFDDEILLGMSALKNIEFSQRQGILTLRQYSDLP